MRWRSGSLVFGLLAGFAPGCGGDVQGAASGSSGASGSGGTSGNGGTSGAAGIDAGSDATVDVATDASTDTATDVTTDATGDVDLDSPVGWVDALDGVWLVGWWGNLNHFSWVRIASTSQFTGSATFLDGQGLTVNAPYWLCNGVGSWIMTAKLRTIGLTFPSSCSPGFEALTFESFSTPTGYPLGADLAAVVTTSASPNAMQAYHFPASQCDAGMSTCADPLM